MTLVRTRRWQSTSQSSSGQPFTPPEGIEDYAITWDFGDATEPQTIYRTAPTQTPGELTTATVNHVYDSTTGSPFIAQVTITGTGEGGIIEGEDTLTVSVSEVPAIEVFAGDWMDVEQNTEVSFSGSFTRPQGLTDVRFEWDFGDGLPPVTGELPEGSTRAYATHVYRDYRPEPYTARLTITAESEVGQIEASRAIEVFVREELGFVVGGYDFADSLKGATRGLSELVQGLLVVLIWLVIFLPIWAVAGGVIWLIVRLLRRRRNRVEGTTSVVNCGFRLLMPAGRPGSALHGNRLRGSTKAASPCTGIGKSRHGYLPEDTLRQTKTRSKLSCGRSSRRPASKLR